MTNTRRALLMLLALAVVKLPLDVALSALLPDASVNTMLNGIAGAAVSLLLLGIPAWTLRPWMSPRLARSKSCWQGVLSGVLLAVMCRVALTPVDAAWQNYLGLAADALPMPESFPVAIVCLLTMAVIPAVTEEAFFRGALLTGLLDGSRRVTAVLLTTLSFTLMHGNAANLPSLMVISLMLTLLMLRTGSIAASVMMHLVYNLTAFVPVEASFGMRLLCGAGLTAVALWWVVRRNIYAHPPMKRLNGLIAGAALAAMAVQYFV